MKNNNLKFKIYFYFLAIIFSFAFLVFNSNKTQAASLFFDSINQEFAPGEEFLVNVFLDTAEESINAVEAKISFPEELLRLKEIRDGNSTINFWVERPKIARADTVSFSGIIPSGYVGAKGFLFSIIFQTKTSGSGYIKINDANVLRNDGKGTPVGVKISPFQISISEKSRFSTQSVVESIKDNEIPEEFKPEIVQNPDIFNGKWFLVFATQDKGSGIDHYKVCERIKTKCVIAESPYVLQNQNLDRKIFIKAIDKNGNERIVVLPPKFAPWYKKPLLYIIFSTAILGVIILMRWLKRKLYRKKH